MKICIVGTGNMGRTLGVKFALAGYEVFFGARDIAQAEGAVALCGGAARSGGNDEAVAFGDIVVWGVRAMPGEVLRDPSLLDGKVVVDMNNGPVPADFHYPPILEAFAERLAKAAPGARVVKAFNTMAQEIFEHDPVILRSHGVSVFLAGDDEEAKAAVGALAEELGFNAIDAGALERAAMLETQADFIRFMIGGMGRGVFATLNLTQLPAVATQRLGGRQPTKLT
ncbi:F420-dependent NADP oxidoreductase [Sphingomonas oleivorans]|uniref:F420-dependent NADP oxidoreductase n=1 Tax=Sphingomonas oleivorans TaxID=1735121 RepID=A0A2T5G2D7_9SPHN|nr:NAD(P)-binding domain-containing protein [Sphingomonas oleivorans]PTQ13313.1 F420-dependent NADP oxidoreductase [Sphingomonas oleivorans]